MTRHCRNCVILRDKVRELERQLGRGYGYGHVGAMVTNLKLTPTQGRIILLLYYRKDWVETDHILRAVDISDESLKSQVHQVRQKLGHDTIESHWGIGYRLSATGMERVSAAIPMDLV